MVRSKVPLLARTHLITPRALSLLLVDGVDGVRGARGLHVDERLSNFFLSRPGVQQKRQAASVRATSKARSKKKSQLETTLKNANVEFGGGWCDDATTNRFAIMNRFAGSTSPPGTRRVVSVRVSSAEATSVWTITHDRD